MVDSPSCGFCLPRWSAGWIVSKQEALAYLLEENRVLGGQLHGRRLRLSNDERRRLALLGHRQGRRRLRQVATIVTPDTISGGIGS